MERVLTVDAGQELRLDGHSDTLGVELFRVTATPWPLNELGELASTADALRVVIPPIGRFGGVYQVIDNNTVSRTFTAGVGTGISFRIQAPYENANGFRWSIKIPAQEQVHQNSAGYRVNVYGR